MGRCRLIDVASFLGCSVGGAKVALGRWQAVVAWNHSKGESMIGRVAETLGGKP